jgi:hypothetical protein
MAGQLGTSYPIICGKINPWQEIFSSLLLHSPPLPAQHVEEDNLTIAEDEVVYKLGPEIEVMEAATEELTSNLIIFAPPMVGSTLESRKMVAFEPPNEAGPNREPQWKDIDLPSFEFSKTLFKRI